jgi:hypothetical protein
VQSLQVSFRHLAMVFWLKNGKGKIKVGSTQVQASVSSDHSSSEVDETADTHETAKMDFSRYNEIQQKMQLLRKK